MNLKRNEMMKKRKVSGIGQVHFWLPLLNIQTTNTMFAK